MSSNRFFMVAPLSYFSFKLVLLDWCNKCRGMCYPVCRIMHTKEPLLLIRKSSPYSGGSEFPLLPSGPNPYVQHQITVNMFMKTQTRKEMFYLTTHSKHFIYGYMASDIWLRTILIVRKETRCRHIGYSYRLTARVRLYAPSHRQDNTYHGFCYTSRGALAGTRNSSMAGPIKTKLITN